jgi:monoterpene epsilon-lactone hydrolase
MMTFAQSCARDISNSTNLLGISMNQLGARTAGTLFAFFLFSGLQPVAAGPVNVQINGEAVATVPAIQVPYSDLASPEAKRNVMHKSMLPKLSVKDSPSIDQLRRAVDSMQEQQLTRLKDRFPVAIRNEIIGHVPVQIVIPAEGVPVRNAHRVLIALHGGAIVGNRYGGLEEATPIASLGSIEVISVDFRMAPEYHFPASSEDVASVYNELLKTYKPSGIGIFGCSSGALLTAQAVAWFAAHQLPRPAAIGLFGQGAIGDTRFGDSNYFAAALSGGRVPSELPDDLPVSWRYMSKDDETSALASPAYHPDTLTRFPPTLLLSGTRDVGLSQVLYTHAHLIDLGVPAELHVWEGAPHCSYAEGDPDPTVPETQQAWRVIIGFFERNLDPAGSGEVGKAGPLK